MNSANVFISYSHQDERSASGLSRLLMRSGISVFSFLHTPPNPGIDFPNHVASHIIHAHFIVLLWSRYSAISTWVAQEVTFAQSHGKIIIPVVLDPDAPLPETLSRTQAILASKDPAGWVVQAGDAIINTLNYRWHQRRIQEPKQKSGISKKLAGGVIGAGIIAALISAFTDNERK